MSVVKMLIKKNHVCKSQDTVLISCLMMMGADYKILL